MQNYNILSREKSWEEFASKFTKFLAPRYYSEIKSGSTRDGAKD